MQKPACIFFDIGGVLVNHMPAYKTIFSQYDVPEQESFSLWAQYADDIDRGTFSWSAFETIYCKTFHISSRFHPSLLEWLVQKIAIIQETHSLIYELKEHFNIGLLSNMSTDFFELVRKYKLIPDIHYVAQVISGDIGTIKPERRIYYYAQEKVSTPPDELLFIDDKEINVETAQSLGWKTVLFDTEKPVESIKRIKKQLAIITNL